MRGMFNLPGASAGPRGRVAGRALAALLALLLFDACAAHRRMAIPGEPPVAGAAPVDAGNLAAVQPGDHVRIRLQSGTELRVVVAEVRPDALVTTRGQRVPYDAMTRLEKRHVSVARTGVLVVAALGLLVMVLTAAAYASLAGGL
ncbi:MAG: hypothetical protein R2708_07475 [Vicinamibacterales bacterium]